MKYIRNNKLFLGTKLSTIKNNLNDIIHYIYYQFSLNYYEMKKIYKHIELEKNELHFENNKIEDNKYIYEFNNYLGHNNQKLIDELHNYLILNRTKDLKLNNINKIKLINTTGINENIRHATNLDWKLHYWDEFIINNNKKSIRLHDLIIAAP